MKVVAGLGNPGTRYAGTRHNVGFATAELLARRWGVRFGRGKCQAALCQRLVGGEQVILAKPKTFMNRSGVAVECLLRMYGVAPSELIVIHDDLDLPLGRVRVKVGGASGGHLGLESVMEEIADRGFVRVRIGIGRPPAGMDPAFYVLERFRDEEKEAAQGSVTRAADAVESLLAQGIERTMNIFNARI